MTALQRRDELNRRTGLAWTAFDGYHSAATRVHRYTLKREWDGTWTGRVIYRGMEYVLATKSGTWEEVCEWLAKTLGVKPESLFAEIKK